MNRDFNIGARSGLLESKHLKSMGQAIWLYLWFIDKQPKDTDKVWGGKPVKYQDVAMDYDSINEKTYRRWLDMLVKGGYITALRVPHGYVVTINKSKKWVKSDRTNMSEHSKPTERTNMSEQKPESSDISGQSHRTNLSKSSDNNVRSNIRATKSNNNKATIPTVSAPLDLYGESLEIPLNDTLPAIDLLDPLTSNALKPSNSRKSSDPEIDLIISEFQAKFDIRLKRMRNQRQMAHHLRNRYGREMVVEMIAVARAVRDEQYAPQILDVQDLWEKWDKLMSYGRRHITAQSKRVANITEDEG